MSWDSGHSSYEGCVQISSREQERPHSAPSHALKTAGPFVPDVLPQRFHQHQKTPHWGGSSAKACQINEDLPAPSSPEIPGSPVRTWSPSLQHVARFQQQGRVCTLSGGNPEWQLCRRNGDRARTGSSTWYRHHGQLEPSSYGDTCCPDGREDLHHPALQRNLPTLNIPFSLITDAVWNSVQRIKGKFAFEELHASCMQTLLWFN